MKRQTLLELVDYVNTGTGKFTEPVRWGKWRCPHLALHVKQTMRSALLTPPGAVTHALSTRKVRTGKIQFIVPLQGVSKRSENRMSSGVCLVASLDHPRMTCFATASEQCRKYHGT